MPSYHNDQAAAELLTALLSSNAAPADALTALQCDLGLSGKEARAAMRDYYAAIGADCDATSDAIAASGGGPQLRRYWSVSSASGAKSADATCGTGEDLEQFSDPLAGL